MHKLLIADCNEEFRLLLAEVLQTSYHVLCCANGAKALELLRTEKPEFLVLDLMLPQLDGITVLESAAAENICPKVLAVTPLLTDYVLDSAQRLQIGYLMRKPCDIQAVAARVADLSQPLTKASPKKEKRIRVSELLLSLSISTKHNGYGYLTEGILMMAQRADLSVTKELYPAVAKIFGCKRGHVERSIRSALEAAWDRGDPQIWQQYFPNTTSRPTNAIFLSRMTEVLLREYE